MELTYLLHLNSITTLVTSLFCIEREIPRDQGRWQIWDLNQAPDSHFL